MGKVSRRFVRWQRDLCPFFLFFFFSSRSKWAAFWRKKTPEERKNQREGGGGREWYPELHEKLSFYDVSINIREDRRRINTSTRRRDTIYYPRYRQSPNDFHPAFEAFSEAPPGVTGGRKSVSVLLFSSSIHDPIFT